MAETLTKPSTSSPDASGDRDKSRGRSSGAQENLQGLEKVFVPYEGFLGTSAVKEQLRKSVAEPVQTALEDPAAGTGFLDALLGTSMLEPPIERHAEIMSDPRFSHPANAPTSSRIVNRMHQTYGNGHVQTVVDLVQAKREIPQVGYMAERGKDDHVQRPCYTEGRFSRIDIGQMPAEVIQRDPDNDSVKVGGSLAIQKEKKVPTRGIPLGPWAKVGKTITITVSGSVSVVENKEAGVEVTPGMTFSRKAVEESVSVKLAEGVEGSAGGGLSESEGKMGGEIKGSLKLNLFGNVHLNTDFVLLSADGGEITFCKLNVGPSWDGVKLDIPWGGVRIQGTVTVGLKASIEPNWSYILSRGLSVSKKLLRLLPASVLLEIAAATIVAAIYIVMVGGGMYLVQISGHKGGAAWAMKVPFAEGYNEKLSEFIRIGQMEQAGMTELELLEEIEFEYKKAKAGMLDIEPMGLFQKAIDLEYQSTTKSKEASEMAKDAGRYAAARYIDELLGKYWYYLADWRAWCKGIKPNKYEGILMWQAGQKIEPIGVTIDLPRVSKKEPAK